MMKAFGTRQWPVRRVTAAIARDKIAKLCRNADIAHIRSCMPTMINPREQERKMYWIVAGLYMGIVVVYVVMAVSH